MFPTRRRRCARITIDLDLDGDNVAGVIRGSGTTRTFHGWLELTAVMDSAHADARLAAGADPRHARRAQALRVART